MKLQRPFLILAATGALAFAGCGDNSDSSEEAGAEATPAEAVQEIGATRTELDTAVRQVRRGDRQQAEETVSEAYLQHFEIVEGPLAKVDEKLNEELEETINSDLREKIRSGAPAAEVERLVTEVKADLATAEAKLR
jgi:hypothetical protein